MRYRSRGCRGRARAVGGAVPLARRRCRTSTCSSASRTAASPDPPRLTSQSGVFGAPMGAKDRPARPKRTGARLFAAKRPPFVLGGGRSRCTRRAAATARPPGCPSGWRRGARSCPGMAGTAEPARPQPATGPATPPCPASSADLGRFWLQETAFLEKMSCKMPRSVQQTQKPRRAELGEGHGRRPDALTGGARRSRRRKTPPPARWCLSTPPLRCANPAACWRFLAH